MAEQAGQSSVLIVTTQRDDRRVLFDTLDAENFDAVYTAKDLPEALAFLEQDPQIDVVVMEFSGHALEAVAFCTQLKGDARLAQVPVIGIAAADPAQRQWDWNRTPPGVVEWMRSPVDAGEVLARVRGVLARHQRGGTIPAAGANADRYQFAFEGNLD
jgi:DNA-binding response OmpR family regulator